MPFREQFRSVSSTVSTALFHRGRRSTTVRVAFWIVVAALGLEATYVVAANSFLAFGGVQKMFASTNTVKGDFASAWTLWPGTIHIRGLELVIQDHNVQSTIQMDRTEVVLRLRELPAKVFHATEDRKSVV